MKKFIVILFLLAMPLTQGCAVFAASSLGYLEAESKYKKLYADYQEKQESAGRPAMEYKEWLKEQPLSRRELKIYKMYGTISEQDAKNIAVEEELEDFEKPE